MARCVVTTRGVDRNGNSTLSVNAGGIKRRPSWDPGLDAWDNHVEAAKAFGAEMGWTPIFASAYMPGNENKVVHIFGATYTE